MAAKVVLTKHEMLQGGLVGLTRQIDNLIGQRDDRFGAQPQDGWRLHVEGALGEIAVAKYLDRYWSGRLGEFKAPDVGPLQVRTRVRQPEASLILHPSDRDEHLFVLVISFAPVFTVVGWLHAKDGKQPQYWRKVDGDRSAYFVPQHVLAPIESLAGAVALEV